MMVVSNDTTNSLYSLQQDGHVFPCLLLDFSDFFDILVAVFDEGLKADLVIRTASVRSEQKVIVGQKKLALLLALQCF